MRMTSEGSLRVCRRLGRSFYASTCIQLELRWGWDKVVWFGGTTLHDIVLLPLTYCLLFVSAYDHTDAFKSGGQMLGCHRLRRDVLH
jgi:hypothetical protein